jgi:hypothetical protein
MRHPSHQLRRPAVARVRAIAHTGEGGQHILRVVAITFLALFATSVLAACASAPASPGEIAPTVAADAEPVDPSDTPAIAIVPTVEGTVPVLPEPEETPMVNQTPAIDELPTTAGTGMGDETALTVAEIMESPEQYLGEEVTVVGELQATFGPNSFKLDEDSFFTAGIDNDLPVIGPVESIEIDDTWLNHQVQVTGTILQYDEINFESDYDWFAPDADWSVEVDENQTVLVADSLLRLDEGAFDPGLGVGPGIIDGTGASDVILTVAEIVGNMEDYAGQVVTVQGEVQETYSTTALRLDEDSFLTGGIDNDLLVVSESGDLIDSPRAEWRDSIVRVNGKVEHYDATAFESIFGFTPEEAIFDDWEGNPVLVADSIEIVRP